MLLPLFVSVSAARLRLTVKQVLNVGRLNGLDHQASDADYDSEDREDPCNQAIRAPQDCSEEKRDASDKEATAYDARRDVHCAGVKPQEFLVHQVAPIF